MLKHTRNVAMCVALILSVTACAGTIQFASISEAYKKYDNGKYEKALTLISQAENAKEMNAEQKGEITYLKAETYEGLGQIDRASTLYEYIRDQHPNSQYAYLARRKLETARQIRLQTGTKSECEPQSSGASSL